MCVLGSLCESVRLCVCVRERDSAEKIGETRAVTERGNGCI